MKKVCLLIITLFAIATIQAQQIGLESSSADAAGNYLSLKSPSPFGLSSSMVFGTSTINTSDAFSSPNVLKLQSNGLGNVVIGITNVTGTGTTDPRLTVRASNENNMDLKLEGHGRVSTEGSFVFYLDENNNANESFDIRESTGGITLMKISEDLKHFLFGDVAIGTPTHAAGYRLSVDGKIMAEEVRVQLSQNWPDYVFEDNYELTSLNTLEKEIKSLGHLPGIPSATQVEEEGFDLGEMNRLLVEKIEELTLHVIELNKEIQLLKTSTSK